MARKKVSKTVRAQRASMHDTMHRFKYGELHSGRGKGGKPGRIVRNRKQAIAIGLSIASKVGRRRRR